MFIPFHVTPGIRGINLRSLTTSDELSVVENNTRSLLSLIQFLISDGGEGGISDSAKIVTADRDRVIAKLYISLYGVKIESTIECTECGQKFDLGFSLEDLLAHFQPEMVSIKEDGIYEVEPGIRFRLPTGEDELAAEVSNVKVAEMIILKRCLLNGDPDSREKVEQSMAEVAPILNQEINASCPECSHNQTVLFDMQSFFLNRLIGERNILFQEIDLIASRYRWSHREILDLPRSLRKQYSKLISIN
jgi:hypothetical protein